MDRAGGRVSAPRSVRGERGIEALVAAAREVRLRAYAPYSKYRVGAAILTRSGKIFTGCNVENATFGATNMRIIMVAQRTRIETTLAALLPDAFRLEHR
jgi:cytidine deaminase